MSRLTSTTRHLYGDGHDPETMGRIAKDLFEMQAHQQTHEVIRVRVDYIDRTSGELRE